METEEMTDTSDAFLSEDADTDTDTETKKESDDETESVDEEEASNPTALLPTSSLGDNPKEGDTVRMKIVKLFDDEVEVQIIKEKKDKSTEKSADAEIDEIAASY